MFSIYLSRIGAKATKIAQQKATAWLEGAWPVIQKTVLDTAERGLFKCNLRFVDVVPQDPENQARLLKLLQKQNLWGTFKTTERDEENESFVTLTVSWGPELI